MAEVGSVGESPGPPPDEAVPAWKGYTMESCLPSYSQVEGCAQVYYSMVAAKACRKPKPRTK